MMAASELLLRRVAAARIAGAMNSREDQMTKDYSRVDIDASGSLGAHDFPVATVAAVGSIVRLTVFLIMFLLVSL